MLRKKPLELHLRNCWFAKMQAPDQRSANKGGGGSKLLIAVRERLDLQVTLIAQLVESRSKCIVLLVFQPVKWKRLVFLRCKMD